MIIYKGQKIRGRQGEAYNNYTCCVCGKEIQKGEEHFWAKFGKEYIHWHTTCDQPEVPEPQPEAQPQESVQEPAETDIYKLLRSILLELLDDAEVRAKISEIVSE